MTESLGQTGLDSKSTLAADCGAPFGFDAEMADDKNFSKLQQDFMRRTIEAREAVKPKISQERMGKLLGGLPQGTYKHYESDRLLPHEYIELFCALTRISPNWLYLGEAEAPQQASDEFHPTVQRIMRQLKGR